MKHLQTAARWLFPFYTVFIGWMSMSPINAINDIGNLDKLAHGVTFLVYAWFCGLMASNVMQFRTAIIACTGYGIIIELVQGLVPGRTSSALDFLADLAGLTLGILVLHLTNHFIPLPGLQGEKKS